MVFRDASVPAKRLHWRRAFSPVLVGMASLATLLLLPACSKGKTPTSGRASGQIPAYLAGSHIGQDVTLYGRVYTVAREGDGTVVLGIGSQTPGTVLRVVQLHGDYGQLVATHGKIVHVKGVIKVDRGLPEIEITSSNQVVQENP